MHERRGADHSRAARLRVRLAADPVSVPGARRFVADALRSWDLPELVDDSTLCVSELAGNAALHSASTFMDVEVRLHRTGVRLSVEDDGIESAEAVAPRPTLLADADAEDLDLVTAPTTGRGLAIVSILASDWGVESTTTGKRVWADLGGETDDRDQVSTSPQLDLSPPVSTPTALPPGWVLVRLAGCPVRLSIRQDEHLDELIRELQLIDAGPDTPRSREIADQLRGLLVGPAHARNTGRRIAERAAAAGLSSIDIDMAMPSEFAAAVRALHIAVQAADRLCEQREMLTLASPADLRSLRAWMTEQVATQIEDGASPVSWTDWLERRDDLGGRG